MLAEGMNTEFSSNVDLKQYSESNSIQFLIMIQSGYK